MDIYRLFDDLQKGEISVDDFSSRLPCIVHIHDPKSLNLLYLDKRSVYRYDVKQEEDWDVPINKMVHPRDIKRTEEIFYHYLEERHDYKTMSHALRVKIGRNTPYQVLFTTVKYLADFGLVGFSVPLDQIEFQETSVDEIVNETDFIFRNAHNFARLTPRDHELISYWLKGQKNAEIAELMRVTPESVKSYKKRIYKKLEIHSYPDLYRYMKAFDFV